MKRIQSKVVDQNYLREPNAELHRFLSSGNLAVLSDYATMEVYKGNSLLNIRRSLEIVSKYPDKVLVLRPTQVVIRVTQAGKRPAARLLIDSELTSDFGDFCSQVYALDQTRLSPELALFESKSRQANDFYRDRLDFAQMVLDAIDTYRIAFSREEFKIIRKGVTFTPELLDKMEDHVFAVAMRFMQLNGFLLRTARQATHNFIFRWSVAAYFLVIGWLSDGGYQALPLQKMQNDIIDMTYVTYATYFDGLLSKDNKMMEIFRLTKAFLRCLGT
jgi:hypothetical protein